MPRVKQLIRQLIPREPKRIAEENSVLPFREHVCGVVRVTDVVSCVSCGQSEDAPLSWQVLEGGVLCRASSS